MLDPLSLFYAFARSLAPFRSRLCNSHLPPLLSETSIFLTKTLFFPSQTLIKPHHSDRFTLSAADIECLPPIPTFLSATSCRPIPPWGIPPANPIETLHTRQHITLVNILRPCEFSATVYSCVCFCQNVHESIEPFRPPSSNASRPLPAH